MDKWNEVLIELQDAIFHAQWGRCVKMIEFIFTSITVQSLKLTLRYAILSHLKYVRRKAELTWLADFSSALSATIEQGFPVNKLPNLPEEMALDYSDKEPGLLRLIVATEQLWQAITKINDVHQCSYLIAQAVGEIIIADLCHYWANVHPKEWHLMTMFWAAETSLDGIVILPESVDREQLAKGVKFRLEPEAIGYQAAKWLIIADEIETLLNQ